MNGLRAIKFHPADTESEPAEQNPQTGRNNFLKFVLAAVITGIGLGIACKFILVSGRYYQTNGILKITCVDGEHRDSALRRHLSGLMMFDRKIRGTSTVNDLVKQGKLNISISQDKDIAVKLIGEDKNNLRKMTQFILAEYIADFSAHRQRENNQISTHQSQVLAEYKFLQDKYAKLKSRLKKLTDGMADDQFNQAIVDICVNMKSGIDKSDEIVNNLGKLNSELTQVRSELINPSVRIDPERLARAKKSDRVYTGDYNLLRLRHRTYLYYLKKEMKGLMSGLTKLRGHLKSISDNVGKHLDGKIPADLADDILELNLAAELYDGKISRFESKCNRYWDKILQILADPEKADFSGTATLLSQLRQDLFARCGDLPEHLSGLYNTLHKGSGSKKSSRRRSILSGAVARNIVSSSVVHDLEQSLQMWNKIVFHLNRHFSDGNVHLKTLGRACRAIQSRLNSQERKIIQKIERKQLAEKKKKLQQRIGQIQFEFEQKSGTLISQYKGLREDQQKLAKIGTSWPEWQKLTQSIADAKYKLTQIKKTQTTDIKSLLWKETLQAGPVIVTAENYFGVLPKWESALSILIGLVGTGIIFLARMGYRLWAIGYRAENTEV